MLQHQQPRTHAAREAEALVSRKELDAARADRIAAHHRVLLLEAKVRQAYEDRDMVQAERGTANAKVVTLEAEVLALRKDRDEARAGLSIAVAQKARLENLLLVVYEERDKARVECLEARARIVKLGTTDDKAVVTRLEAEVLALRKALNEARAGLSVADAQKARLEKLENALSVLHKDRHDAEVEVLALRKERDNTEAEALALRQERVRIAQQLEAEIQVMRKDRDALLTGHADMQRQLKAAEERAANATRLADGRWEKLRDAGETLDKRDAAIKALEAKNAATEVFYVSAGKHCDRLEQQMRDIQATAIMRQAADAMPKK
jgi:chromosome segregation ATPase